jgi:hypothetical protein
MFTKRNEWRILAAKNLDSGLCIFHDECYLQDKNNLAEREREVTKRLMDKVAHSIDCNKALFCIGYRLPGIEIKGNFTTPVYFSHANFSAPANFSAATFSARAYFTSAKFFGEANFSAATFSARSYFNSATFSARAYFTSAKFFGEANFSAATFSARSYFNSATFSARAHFSRATFSARADFILAKFFGEAYFTSAKFFEGADLYSSKFSAPANFSLATFSGKSTFSRATFSAPAYFTSAKFFGEANFTTEFKDKASFNNMIFEDGNKILFETEDLSKVSFMNTDISMVRFSDRARWGEKDKFKTIDERKLEEKIKRDGKTKEINLGSIKAVYRSLRDNYEYRMRYDEASQFFIREMELKRKYSEKESSSGSEVIPNDRFRRNLSITGLYYHLFRYGESLSRIAFTIVLFFSLTTLFWVIYPPSLIPQTLSNQENLKTSVVNAYILRFMKIATEKTVDGRIQSQIYHIGITKLAEMRKAVNQALNSFHGGRLNILFYGNIYTEEMLQKHAKIFKDAGIKEEAEPLLQSIAQIYKDID